MDKMIITFGQSHAHALNNRTFDKDCVAVIECKDYNDGRTIAHSMFGTQFCMAYMEDEFPVESMKYYHRGKIPANYQIELSDKCKGIELGDGEYSGCTQLGGDCPVCGL